jgi:hypothetical protein
MCKFKNFPGRIYLRAPTKKGCFGGEWRRGWNRRGGRGGEGKENGKGK